MSMTAWLFWGLVFSSVGMGYFIYGKKQGRAAPLLCGIALMVYPYFIDSAWATIGIGVALMAIPYFARY
ncbi:MAG TPA: hypothetical protein VK753_07780 [Xanthomonadaceae bacterium]|jgi:hypothetical protein|nr:hypothetical protein [Xanthomonadaceae bacterium]